MTEPYVMESHAFHAFKGIYSACCAYCGLVRSNNYLTEFAIKHGCNWDDHPRAAWAIKNLPKQWVERNKNASY